MVVKKKGTRKKAIRKTSARKAVGITVNVYDSKGRVVGKTALPKSIFGAKVNPVLMAQAVRVYLANQRVGTAQTLTRGEVRGSTRKIYRQKHTGRARHGAIRAPLFVGGGVVFGPKPRDYSLKFSKKMRKSALLSALTSRANGGAVKVITGLEKLTPKTRIFKTLLDKITDYKKGLPAGRQGRKILIILPGKVVSIERATRNLKGVTVRPINTLTTYEVLAHNPLFFMKESILKMEEFYGKKEG